MAIDPGQHPILPLPYIVTEEEHRIAYLSTVLDRIVYDYLLAYDMDLRKDVGPDPAYGDKRIKGLLKHLFEGWNDDNEAWERLWPYEDFKRQMDESLAGSHCGDCTAVAASCTRCHAEELYKKPYTATWNGKHEGWRLLWDFREKGGKDV